MNNIRNRKSAERGEVMIESLIVYLVTFTLLFLILGLLLITYQKLTVKTVAADTAVKIAENIRYNSSDFDIATGTYSETDFANLKAYRYLFGNFSKLCENVKKKGISYGNNRLMNSSFAKTISGKDPEITVEFVSDGPALRHVTVTIVGKYKVPFDEIFDFFGMEKLTTYTATESAECMDIIDYINYIDFSKTIVSTLYDDTGKIGKLVDKIWTLVNKFVNY